jgi:para-nitrobenzyl esterase
MASDAGQNSATGLTGLRAVEHARTSGAPVWVYRFGARPPLPSGAGLAAPPDGLPGYGAFHTAELLYAWDNLSQRDWPWTGADLALAAVMSAVWARFAATGDPNSAGLAGWPEFSAKDNAGVLRFANPDGADAHRPAQVVRVGAMDRLAAMHVLDGRRGLNH